MALSEYKRALVTGASSGIGRATAQALAERGLAVHAVARRADRLTDLAKTTGITPHALDLRDTRAIYDKLAGLEVDVLVNNAGTARGFEGLCKASPEDIDSTLETNVVAVLSRAPTPRSQNPGQHDTTGGSIFNVAKGSISDVG
jgi:NADP-dependent 3-hydroxy acid dehydrogenase YdfG